MGYTTDFEGSIQISPPLNEAERSFLRDLATTRRMNRTKGPLFIQDTVNFGQHHDPDVLDYNNPHPHQPSLWLQWEPSEDGKFLQWDGGEKFYGSAEWMEYIVNGLLSPEAEVYVKEHLDEDPRLAEFQFNHICNGSIDAEGEDPDDRWTLIVVNNEVRAESKW